MALTARQIDTAKSADKDYKLSDAGGLYLLVKKNGAKYWFLKYCYGSKEKKLSIGVYPSVPTHATSSPQRIRCLTARGNCRETQTAATGR